MAAQIMEPVAPAPGYGTAVSKHIDAYPHASAAQIAEAVAGELTDAQIHDLAVWHLRAIAEQALRSRARRVETRSRGKVVPFGESSEAPAEPVVKHESVTWNTKGRKACERCGCTACVGALKAFYAEEEEWSKGYMSKLGELTKDLTETLSEQIRLEITEELLSTEFALGDGSRVTWGTATAEDHERRIEMLERNISATADTAAKHRAAIKMLEAQSARTLADVEVAA